MRPIVNMSEDDLATDIGSMHKKIVLVLPVALSMGKKTPSRRYAMRPIVIVPVEDRARTQGTYTK